MGVLAGTPGGQLRVEMRAGVPDDVIRVGILDERKTPGPLTIRLEYPGTKEGRDLGIEGSGRIN